MKNPLDEHSDAAFFTRFGIVMTALILLAGLFGTIAYALERRYQQPDDLRMRADIDKRTTPVATVVTSNEQLAALTPATASGPATPQSGDQIVATVCGACHNGGLLGAPKAHDKSAWQPRLAANGGGRRSKALSRRRRRARVRCRPRAARRS